MHLRFFIFSLLIGSFFATTTDASEISLIPLKSIGDHANQAIVVSGDLLYSDISMFKSIADKAADGTLVLLSSPGGDLLSGIQIGREIKRRHFITGVIDVCASACALAWLAGETRSFAADAKVGFHVAYYEGVEKRESGMGNALVGLYVGELGFKDNVVKYITSAPPDNIQWITPRDASLLGIDVTVIDTSKTTEEQKPAEQKPLETSEPKLSSSEFEKKSQEFVLSAINANTLTSPIALTSVLMNYSSQVDYFGSKKNLSEVYEDKSKYFLRWPFRSVIVKSETLSTKCENYICTVSGLYDWTVENSSRNKKKSGTALFNYKVYMDKDPKIIFETGEIIKKN